MAIPSVLEVGQQTVSEFHKKYGVLCKVEGLTWNATKRLFEPPYTLQATDVPCIIVSLSSMPDPDVGIGMAQALNISFVQYRQITLPVGLVVVSPNAIITKLALTTDRYQVVQPFQADESSPLEVRLHCKKL